MFGANGVNVFHKGKIRIKNKLKNSWDTFFMGVHFVTHGAICFLSSFVWFLHAMCNEFLCFLWIHMVSKLVLFVGHTLVASACLCFFIDENM